MVVATALVAQAVPGRSASAKADRYAALDAFAQALAYVSHNYVEDVDERSLVYGAIGGMIRDLDPHSTFLPPARYQQLRQDTEGEFGGVGVRLGPGTGDDAHPVIAEIVPASPAARAGLATGDRVLAIAGQDTAGGKQSVSPKVWHSHLRGPAGSRIELRVWREGWEAPEERSLVRERIKVPTVDWMALGPVGYVSIRKFQEATSRDVAAALEGIAKRGGGRVGGLVLDLRGNPGGLLDQGIRVADLFLDEGIIVSVRGRRGRADEIERAHAAGSWLDFPMVVLVDERSASAAEIVAGALQDHGRARIVGVPTYGKGSVQTFLDLTDGSGLKLTTSRYYTPSGRSLEGVGIEPDQLVESFEEVIVAGSEGAARPEPAPPSAAVRALEAPLRRRLADDRQLTVAYETLLGQVSGLGRKHAARVGVR